MSKRSRASFLHRFTGALLATVLLNAFSANVSAQETTVTFPTKPIHIYVPFPPGGAADLYARFIGDKLSQSWNQPVVVENRPGGGGQIATQAAARAPADGHTLLVVTVGHAVNPHLYPKLPYDTEKDLEPVARLATLPSVLLVNNNVPAHSVAELLALVRAKPGKLSYASSGNATTSHVAAAMFTNLAKIDILHVPYKGSAPAIADLIGGQVDIMIDPLTSSAQHIKTGKLRALAISTATRSPLAPELPTLAESGLAGYDFSAWFLLLAPSNTPDSIVKKINGEIQRIMTLPATREKFRTLGAVPGQGTTQELRQFLSGEIKRYGDIVKAANMRAE